MLLPIYAYGHPVLRQACRKVEAEQSNLTQLIEDMWETMYHTQGMGLAAPQVGRSLRLFLVDSLQLDEEELEGAKGIKEVFINPEILEQGGKAWTYEEGCLSIPEIRGKVERLAQVKIRYQNQDFETQERVFSGLTARIIQHEYDHIQGVLFTDHLSPLKKRLLKKSLEHIQKGRIRSRYKMIFA